MSVPLPKGYEALSPFAAEWGIGCFHDRYERRFGSDMASLQAFYDAAQPLADRALRELEQHDLAALPEAYRNLFNLIMSLAHVAVAIERHGQPQPRNVTWPATLEVTQGSFPP